MRCRVSATTALSAGRPAAFVYDGPGPFPGEVRALLDRLYWRLADSPAAATVALAPRLHRRLPAADLAAPLHGTLIFHPSALPYRRGPDAIRAAVAAGDRVSGATWFWGTDQLDAGPICEAEVVVLRPGESAGRAYHTRFIPAGLRALERALKSIALGTPRRIAQDESLATYDRPPPHPVERMGPA